MTDTPQTAKPPLTMLGSPDEAVCTDGVCVIGSAPAPAPPQDDGETAAP